MPEIVAVRVPSGNVRRLLVPILVREIEQLRERHHGDADLVLELPDQILGVIRTVERLPVESLPGPGVVAADDEVVRAVIAPDDRVPDRFSRSGHAHRQRQQRQDDAVGVVVVLRQCLVGADSGVMVDVAGLGHADRRVQQQHAVDRVDGALGQLLVHAVQRVARLERDHILAPGLGQHLARLRRRAAQLLKVIVPRESAALGWARSVQPAPAGHLVDQRMFRILGAEHALRQIGRIPGIELVDRHDREQIVHRIAQGDVCADPQPGIGRDRQRHWDREERAIGEPHLGEHAPEVRLAHEPVKRRKRPGGQHLQVADRAGRHLQRGQGARVGPRLGELLSGTIKSTRRPP